VASVKLDQAFLQAFLDGFYQLPVAHENIPYQPTAGTAYAQVRVLQNDRTGYTLADRDITDGVFQIILRYPAGTGAVAAKQKADEIFTDFPIGSQVEYGGQAATITRHRRQPGAVEDAWFVLVLTLDYRAKLERYSI